MRVAIDIDGVLCDFISGFNQRIVEVTGENRFPLEHCLVDNYVPTCWDYAQKTLGYTNIQMDAVWRSIKSDPEFWVHLTTLPGLWQWDADGHDVYYITDRPGIHPKAQTEVWLEGYDIPSPTVLVSAHKGTLCAALDIDCFLDDKPGNIISVQCLSPSTRAYLLECPWNATDRVGIKRTVQSVGEFVKLEGLK